VRQLRFITIAAVVLVLLLAIGLPRISKESVLGQLIRLQKQTGLSLVTLENRSVLAVVFWRSSVVKARDLPGGLEPYLPMEAKQHSFQTGNHTTS